MTNETPGPKAPKLYKVIYDPKPIPMRQFDYCATFDDYEPGCPIGWGRTMEDAVSDLFSQIEDLTDEA